MNIAIQIVYFVTKSILVDLHCHNKKYKPFGWKRKVLEIDTLNPNPKNHTI